MFVECTDLGNEIKEAFVTQLVISARKLHLIIQKSHESSFYWLSISLISTNLYWFMLGKVLEHVLTVLP